MRWVKDIDTFMDGQVPVLVMLDMRSDKDNDSAFVDRPVWSRLHVTNLPIVNMLIMCLNLSSIWIESCRY